MVCFCYPQLLRQVFGLFQIRVCHLRCSALILRVQHDTWGCKKADPCDHMWISQGESLQLHSSWADLLITCDEDLSRGKTRKPHMANCCKLQWAPLVSAHIGPTIGKRVWTKHGNYRCQTCMGFMWVPCGYLERQNTWAPLGKLLHTAVCPINGSPRVAHERHTPTWALHGANKILLSGMLGVSPICLILLRH